MAEPPQGARGIVAGNRGVPTHFEQLQCIVTTIDWLQQQNSVTARSFIPQGAQTLVTLTTVGADETGNLLKAWLDKIVSYVYTRSQDISTTASFLLDAQQQVSQPFFLQKLTHEFPPCKTFHWTGSFGSKQHQKDPANRPLQPQTASVAAQNLRSAPANRPVPPQNGAFASQNPLWAQNFQRLAESEERKWQQRHRAPPAQESSGIKQDGQGRGYGPQISQNSTQELARQQPDTQVGRLDIQFSQLLRPDNGFNTTEDEVEGK